MASNTRLIDRVPPTLTVMDKGKPIQVLVLGMSRTGQRFQPFVHGISLLSGRDHVYVLYPHLPDEQPRVTAFSNEDCSRNPGIPSLPYVRVHQALA